MGYVPFRCYGCANTERVGHLIKGQRCDIGEIISAHGCSSFKPDITASCSTCYYNPISRFDDHKCNKTGNYIASGVSYCQYHAEKQQEPEKKGGCFVTTAICNVLGYPDDCETLTSLRHFRDRFLLSSDFHYLVDDYYARSGRIVDYIENCSDPVGLALHLQDAYLQEIVYKIEQGVVEEVISDYKSMVEYLETLIEHT
jgi:hypothetical protein